MKKAEEERKKGSPPLFLPPRTWSLWRHWVFFVGTPFFPTGNENIRMNRDGQGYDRRFHSISQQLIAECDIVISELILKVHA